MEEGGAEQGTKRRLPPAATPQASRDLVPPQAGADGTPWRGRAGLTDSRTFRWPAGVLRRQTPRFAAGSRSCSGRFFSCCTGVHIAVQMPFREPEAEFLLSDCAFLLPTRFLHRPCTPGRLAGEPAHPCARQASAGSARLVCPGVRGSSGRVAGGSQWEASASGTLPVGV